MASYKLTEHTTATLTPQLMAARQYFVRLADGEFYKIVKTWPDGVCVIERIFRGVFCNQVLRSNTGVIACYLKQTRTINPYDGGYAQEFVATNSRVEQVGKAFTRPKATFTSEQIGPNRLQETYMPDENNF